MLPDSGTRWRRSAEHSVSHFHLHHGPTPVLSGCLEPQQPEGKSKGKGVQGILGVNLTVVMTALQQGLCKMVTYCIFTVLCAFDVNVLYK